MRILQFWRVLLTLGALAPLTAWAQGTMPRPGAAQIRKTQPPAANSAQSSSSATTPRAAILSAPQVVFANGNLTIHAHNSTLTDILAAVRRKTGAQVEAPPSASSERVVVDLGPGPADDVLADLLNGSRYDYVILASARDPRDLSYIMLQEKTGGAGQPEAQSQAQQPQDVPAETDEDTAQEAPAEVEAEPPAEQQPDAAPPQPAPDNNGTAENNNGNQDQPKTPEQLLEELKQMQQQQQQGNVQQQPPQQNEPQQQQPNQQYPPEQNSPPQ